MKKIKNAMQEGNKLKKMQINNNFHFKCIHNTWVHSYQSLHYVYQHFSTGVMRTHRGMPAVAKRYARKKYEWTNDSNKNL